MTLPPRLGGPVPTPGDDDWWGAALGVVLAAVTIGLSIASFRFLREGGLSYY